MLGHNVIGHDLPILKQQAPLLALHGLPVVDTLRLSPLAFPQNPYHRLVKDYKLIRDSLNSPLSDCHSTLTLFNDQRQASLNNTHQAELLCYQALLAPALKSDLGDLFESLIGLPYRDVGFKSYTQLYQITVGYTPDLKPAPLFMGTSELVYGPLFLGNPFVGGTPQDIAEKLPEWFYVYDPGLYKERPTAIYNAQSTYLFIEPEK